MRLRVSVPYRKPPVVSTAMFTTPAAAEPLVAPVNHAGNAATAAGPLLDISDLYEA